MALSARGSHLAIQPWISSRLPGFSGPSADQRGEPAAMAAASINWASVIRPSSMSPLWRADSPSLRSTDSPRWPAWRSG